MWAIRVGAMRATRAICTEGIRAIRAMKALQRGIRGNEGYYQSYSAIYKEGIIAKVRAITAGITAKGYEGSYRGVSELFGYFYRGVSGCAATTEGIMAIRLFIQRGIKAKG